MATKIQHILKSNPDTKILFGEWLSRQGLDAKSQYAYMKSGWWKTRARVTPRAEEALTPDNFYN